MKKEALRASSVQKIYGGLFSGDGRCDHDLSRRGTYCSKAWS